MYNFLACFRNLKNTRHRPHVVLVVECGTEYMREIFRQLDGYVLVQWIFFLYFFLG